jgi:hypothetical protein
MYLIFPYNWQDCVCLVAPYPYGPSTKDQFNVKTDMDLSGDGLLWYARPQLFFNCTVAPVGQLARKARHTELSLVFFSTFEPIKLTPNSVMQRNGVPMFFDSASSTNLPSLYICRAENVLGRVPLMPCYIGGNSHPTLPHRFGTGNRAGATADSSVDRGNGSRLYELNLWMWRYGRGQPRKVTVAEAEQRRKERLTEARKRAVQTLKRRREERGTRVGAGDNDAVGDE